MSLIPRTGAFGETDFFAPFFSGWPGFEGSLVPRVLGETGVSTQLRSMPVDVTETDKSVVVRADVPGVKKEDIKVTVDGDVLRINVETSQKKEEEKEEGGVKWHRYERASSFVGRALRMPEHADLDKVKASYKDGVLSLDIPKKAGKEAGMKTITVG